ncbi:exosortase family protein XrtF [Ulvibacter litoralis]|uniref:Exosortase family protein XrtF n=1 Tax=Ulvibacter litoralis TaxID=227084 RepID=A0A1G7CF57_9FLAO|nr:exosortase family protein XrtF [Ulvibacter litoralis]SDE37380.1 exosortase family protein XrtF [Ulvibacter litoralis]
MKALFVKYKSVVRFVFLFLGTYLLLSVGYALYLKASEGSVYYPDFVTHLVAKQSTAILSGFGYPAAIYPHDSKPQMVLYLNNEYMASIVEGCNSLSIIVLFIAFVVAFAQRFKKTILFLLAGSVLIYAVNIVRIVILVVALHAYPEYEKLLHGVVFPGIIYGMVFLLWMLWIKKLDPITEAEND